MRCLHRAWRTFARHALLSTRASARRAVRVVVSCLLLEYLLCWCVSRVVCAPCISAYIQCRVWPRAWRVSCMLLSRTDTGRLAETARVRWTQGTLHTASRAHLRREARPRRSRLTRDRLAKRRQRSDRKTAHLLGLLSAQSSALAVFLKRALSLRVSRNTIHIYFNQYVYVRSFDLFTF